ncbi:hypothetical protein PCK1_001216 [Pneumocystis canis]|nr:hypothetical protein PCK1_001216 [Pneumocystis canis]
MRLYLIKWALQEQIKTFSALKRLNIINKRISWMNCAGICPQSSRISVFLDESSSQLILNENENRVRNLLLSVAEFCKCSGEPVTLRFAGGWVRDKLLGTLTKYPHIAKIERNPVKSKHLETATTYIMNMWIDFVNLRSETYSSDSRVPNMTFGTPEEDALRRDFTVNALFYNLHTSQIEDFTKRGLEDMKLKRIATPLEPYRTFDDDPLRILRCIRFASYLGFEIDAEAKLAIMHPEIKVEIFKSLSVKISKERIGIELEKMLKGPDPYNCLVLIHELGLYENIFTADNLKEPKENMKGAVFALDFVKWMIYDSVEEDQSKGNLRPISCQKYSFIHPSIQFFDHSLKNPFKPYMDLLGINNNMIFWLLSALIPWKEQILQNKKGFIQCSAIVVKDGLKMSNSIVRIVEDSFTYFQEAQKISMQYINGNPTRLSLGLFVRLVKKNWPFAVFLGLIDDIITLLLQKTNCFESLKKNEPVISSIESLTNEKQSIFKRYQLLLDQICYENLQNAYSMQPLINGHVLSKTFGLKGPQIGHALEQVIQWQLQNPKGTAEQCLEQMSL